MCACGAELLGDLHTAPRVIKPPPLRQKGRKFKGGRSTPAVFPDLVTIPGRREGECASCVADTAQQETQMMEHPDFIRRERTKGNEGRRLLNKPSAGLFLNTI